MPALDVLFAPVAAVAPTSMAAHVEGSLQFQALVDQAAATMSGGIRIEAAGSPATAQATPPALALAANAAITLAAGKPVVEATIDIEADPALILPFPAQAPAPVVVSTDPGTALPTAGIDTDETDAGADQTAVAPLPILTFAAAVTPETIELAATATVRGGDTPAPALVPIAIPAPAPAPTPGSVSPAAAADAGKAAPVSDITPATDEPVAPPQAPPATATAPTPAATGTAMAAELARQGVVTLTGRVAASAPAAPAATTSGADAEASEAARPTAGATAPLPAQTASAAPVAPAAPVLVPALAAAHAATPGLRTLHAVTDAASPETAAPETSVAADPTDLAAPNTAGPAAAAATPVADTLAVTASPVASPDEAALPPALSPGLNAATTGETPAAATTGGGVSVATAETTALLASQIARRLETRVTRFDLTLTPEGLGEVDVSLDIDADGGVTARLAFDNPLAAADMRGRADELRRQLQDAGFTVAQDALTFADKDSGQSGGDRSGHPFFDQDRQSAGRAFAGAGRLAQSADTALVTPAWASPSRTPTGVDLKV
jgi:flagellar hook-length control protein FliK